MLANISASVMYKLYARIPSQKSHLVRPKFVKTFTCKQAPNYTAYNPVLLRDYAPIFWYLVN